MMCRVYNFEVLPVSLRPATDMHFGCALRYGTFVAIKEPNVVEQ